MPARNIPHPDTRVARTRPKKIEMGPVNALARPRKHGPDPDSKFFVRADGKAYWQARKAGSRAGRETVWSGWATRDEAVTAIAQAIADGLDSPSRRGSRKGGSVRTMGDLFDAWVSFQDNRASVADTSKRIYRYKAGYWKAEVGNMLASRFERSDAENVINDWESPARDVAPRTIETAVKVLKMAIKWGAKRGYCRRLDLDKLAPTIRQDEKRYAGCRTSPRPDQADAVIEGVHDEDQKDALGLQAVTGARVGEIAAIRPKEDYDIVRKVLWLHGKDPNRGKRGKKEAREYPLPPQGVEIVERTIARNGWDGYLFPTLGQYPQQTLNNALRAACELAGVTRFSTHGLRRMMIMRSLEAGIDPQTLSRLTGHSVKTLLTYYVQPTEASLRKAAVQSMGQGAKVLQFPAAASEAGVRSGGTS